MIDHHIRDVFREEKLQEKSNVQKMHVAGGRACPSWIRSQLLQKMQQLRPQQPYQDMSCFEKVPANLLKNRHY